MRAIYLALLTELDLIYVAYCPVTSSDVRTISIEITVIWILSDTDHDDTAGKAPTFYSVRISGGKQIAWF
jgi:hypothetical protein